MLNPITENLENNDTRELPTERGPRGVSVAQEGASNPEPVLTPRSASPIGSEALLGEIDAASESAIRAASSRPDVGGIPEPQLTPISVGNPVLDPNTYTSAFTRELQDNISSTSAIQGQVPTYAGSTYQFPDTTPVAVDIPAYNPSDFVRPQAGEGGATNGGGFLQRAYEQYSDPAHLTRTDLRNDGLDIDPTTNVLNQSASGIGGVFSLARRGVTSLFRASNAAGQELIGAPDEDAGFAERAARAAGSTLLGSTVIPILNRNSRQAWMNSLRDSWRDLGDNEREAIRQISPTSGAGNAGTRGPLQGDFGEYGSSFLGGVNYVFDGNGNQVRANIAARIEVSDNPLELATNLILAPATNKELAAAARRNAEAAWLGKEYSFVNPDSPLALVGDKFSNPNGTRLERLATQVSRPFRIAAGIALDTITGPDPTDIIGWLRQPAGKGARAVTKINAPTSAGAIVRSTTPGSLVRPAIDVDARPYPTALVPGPRGGELAIQRPNQTSAIARDIITVDPYPVPPRLPARALPGAPELRALPGTLPRPQLPPSGGVNIGALLPTRPNAPLLDDVRVLPNLPAVGTPDPTPGLPRPRVGGPGQVIDLGEPLSDYTADLPKLDLRTGRITPVANPDLDSVAPPRIASFDDIEPVEFETPARQRVNTRDDIPDEVRNTLDNIPSDLDDVTLNELYADIDLADAGGEPLNVVDLDAARQLRDDLDALGWEPVEPIRNEKVSTLKKGTQNPIAAVSDEATEVLQGNFPDRPRAEVVDIFTRQVREAPTEALEDVDLSRKVLEHSTAAGTTLVTDKGAVVRADQFLNSGARQIEDLQIKANLAREAGDNMRAAQHEAVIRAIRGSTKDNPVSPPSRVDVLTPDEVDELVPPVTVEQLTPVRRADQAVRELRSTNLLQQAFDLNAIERSNLVTRRREDLQALAYWLGHAPDDVNLTWAALRRLHDKYGLYAAFGPAVNGFELDRARRNGVRVIEQVEQNALLNVPSQRAVIASTPKVLKNQVHKAAVAEQSLIGNENVLQLLQGKPLDDDVVADLVEKWVNSPGRSSTRRNLNKVLDGRGYQYTPDQLSALRSKYGALPKNQQAKLPKGLRDALRDPLPPTPVRNQVGDTPTLADVLEPGVTAKELRATAVPSELRTAPDETLARFVETRSRALDTRQALVEAGSDLAIVRGEQAQLYQELAGLPELEPRSVLDGNWDTGRVNERVETVLEVLNTPVVRRTDDPTFTGSMVPYAALADDDLFYGSPFLGGVENPRGLPLGSANPLRGAYPPGFAVITNDPKLARSLAQGRVPDNTVLGELTIQPVVDKVYLSPDSIILDGNSPLPPAEYERLLTKLSEFIDPLDRDTLRDILKQVPDLSDAPLGRIMERLQEGWAKLNPTTAPDDKFFAALGSGYREYVGRNGDAIAMVLPGNRRVVLTPSPERALAEQFQRNVLDVDGTVPSDTALYRTYADEVLAEEGGTLSKVLGTNNRNQHAVELAQELADETDRLNADLDRLLDEESALKAEAFALQEQQALDESLQLELSQSASIELEFDELYDDLDLNDYIDPGCL